MALSLTVDHPNLLHGNCSTEMSFRKVLRDGTRAEHDRLDDMFTALDITQPDDFMCFSTVHLICFQAMAEVVQTGSYSHQLLRQMAASLAADLDVLGAPHAPIRAAVPPLPDPLAIDYIVAGSRLGSKVLKKRWLLAQDPTVRRANAYFGMNSNPAFWPQTCQALDAITPASARADAIVGDTKSLFQLFSTAYHHTMTEKAVTP